MYNQVYTLRKNKKSENKFIQCDSVFFFLLFFLLPFDTLCVYLFSTYPTHNNIQCANIRKCAANEIHTRTLCVLTPILMKMNGIIFNVELMVLIQYIILSKQTPYINYCSLFNGYRNFMGQPPSYTTCVVPADNNNKRNLLVSVCK